MALCVVLDAVCEAYGSAPSERMGIDGSSFLALSFDASVRQVAQEWQSEQVKKGQSSDGMSKKERLEEQRKLFGDMVRSLPEGSKLRRDFEREWGSGG